MGRPREFDLDEVLEAATEAFWRRGYEATSICDLQEATGLQRGSLYKAFGDKHGLFLAALQRYHEAARQMTEEILSGDDSPRARLEAWLQGAAQRCAGENGRMGCMHTNVQTELAPRDEAITEEIRCHRDWLEERLAAVVAEGQSAGELRDDRTPRELGRHILTVAVGLSVTGKAGLSLRQAKAQARLGLDALDAGA